MQDKVNLANRSSTTLRTSRSYAEALPASVDCRSCNSVIENADCQCHEIIAHLYAEALLALVDCRSCSNPSNITALFIIYRKAFCD